MRLKGTGQADHLGTGAEGQSGQHDHDNAFPKQQINHRVLILTKLRVEASSTVRKYRMWTRVTCGYETLRTKKGKNSKK